MASFQGPPPPHRTRQSPSTTTTGRLATAASCTANGGVGGGAKSGPVKAVQAFGLVKGSSPPAAASQPHDAQNPGCLVSASRRFSPDSVRSESPVNRVPILSLMVMRKGLPVFFKGGEVLQTIADRFGLLYGGIGIRRTGSFDLISSSIYLNGEWPKLCAVIGQECLTFEKSTQTPEEWKDVHLHDPLMRPVTKLAKEKPSVFYRAAASKPLQIPAYSRLTSHCRGSLEGLNQEIEKLVTNGNLAMDCIKSPMDGRREPVAYQLNTCSRVTQTPTTVDDAAGKMELDMFHDGQRREETHEELDDCDIKVFKESPECINFHSLKAFNGRLPPEGCEKVEGKFKEVRDHELEKIEVPFMKQLVAECHIPSELSAFNPLAKSYISQPVELARQLTGLTILQPRD